ncbi:MAG: hypothetical protein RLY70_4691 [Planctomycetota bacterium]
MDTKVTKKESDNFSNRVTGCAIEVHRHLGPGQKTGLKRFVLLALRVLRVLRGTPIAVPACLPWEHATRSNAPDRSLNATRNR